MYLALVNYETIINTKQCIRALCGRYILFSPSKYRYPAIPALPVHPSVFYRSLGHQATYDKEGTPV